MNKAKSFNLLLIIALSFVLIIPLVVGFIYGWKPTEPEFALQYLAVTISSISTLIVAITLILQRQQLTELSNSNNKNFQISQNNYDTNVLNLIENLFLSKEMAKVRNTCFHFKEQLKESPDLKIKVKEIFKMQISDNWGKFEEFKKIVGEEVYTNYYAFERLARYFDTISNYQMSATTSQAIHYYYVWWRGLILDMKQCFLEAASELSEADRHLTFNPNWVSASDRLDQQLQKFNLPLN